MSGHSDLGILKKFVSIFHFHLGISWYCVCCLSIATRQFWKWYPWSLLLSFEMLKILVQWILHERLCSSGSSRLSPSGSWGEHLSTHHALLASGTARFCGPIRFPQHLFSVHDHGRQRSGRGPQHTFNPLRWPDCTLSRLRAEEYGRPVTQSIATPEPSSRTIPTLDRTLVAR